MQSEPMVTTTGRFSSPGIFVPPGIQQQSDTDLLRRPRLPEKPHAIVGAPLVAEKEAGGVAGGRALRQFLHAIHACPTASAAWLNASEVCGQQSCRKPLTQKKSNKHRTLAASLLGGGCVSSSWSSAVQILAVRKKAQTVPISSHLPGKDSSGGCAFLKTGSIYAAEGVKRRLPYTRLRVFSPEKCHFAPRQL